MTGALAELRKGGTQALEASRESSSLSGAWRLHRSEVGANSDASHTGRSIWPCLQVGSAEMQ